MAKASRETARTTMDFEAVNERTSELDGYTVNFLTMHQDVDLAPILAGLPGGVCRCPHWGVMTKGTMTATYADHTEVYEPGDAFYMPPGHTAATDAGAEFVLFSPTDELAATDAAIAAAMNQPVS